MTKKLFFALVALPGKVIGSVVMGVVCGICGAFFGILIPWGSKD